MSVLLPVVVLVAALIVGLMTWLNVRERRAEIGLLRALGKRTTQIASLFLAKSLIVGLVGGLVASLVCWAAYHLLLIAPSAPSETALFRPSTLLLALTVLGAPLVTTMAAYLPTLQAIAQDPADPDRAVTIVSSVVAGSAGSPSHYCV